MEYSVSVYWSRVPVIESEVSCYVDSHTLPKKIDTLCVVIGLTLERPNIKLIVEPCPNLYKLCEVLPKELLEKRNMAKKMVVFCRSLKCCANMCLEKTLLNLQAYR